MLDNIYRWHKVKFLCPSLAVIIPSLPPALESLEYEGPTIIYLIAPMTTADLMDKVESHSEWWYTNRCRSAIVAQTSDTPGKLLGELRDAEIAASALQHEDHSSFPLQFSTLQNPGHTQDCTKPPALQRLSVGFQTQQRTLHKSSLADMIRHSGVSLVELDVVVIDAADLCLVLKCSPRLRVLSLTHGAADIVPLFIYLTVPTSQIPNVSGVICPMLQELELHGVLYNIGDAQNLVDMVVSRWSYAKKKRLGLSLFTPLVFPVDRVDEGRMEELKRCVSEGLDYVRSSVMQPVGFMRRKGLS